MPRILPKEAQIVAFLLVINCRLLAGENIALRKSYTLAPAPNYPLCTDDNDSAELTDGKTFGSNWTQRTTVGWSRSPGNIEIYVDLKMIYQVNRVRLHSVGGGKAGVEYPEFIAVLTSRDAQNYSMVGFLESTSLARGKSQKEPYVFDLDGLDVAARHVKLIIRPFGLYFFLDEIEIYGTDNRSGAESGFGAGYCDVSRLSGDIDDFLKIRRSLEETNLSFDKYKDRLTQDSQAKIRAQLQNLNNLVSEPERLVVSEKERQQCRLRADLARAALYKAVWEKELIISVADPMQSLAGHEFVSPGKQDPNKIDLFLWRAEYESAAVNFINATEQAESIMVSISPLTDMDGAAVESESTFTVRRATYVNAAQVGAIADALVLQKDKPFVIEPGRVSQLWLTVFNPVLPAGKYQAALAISTDKESLLGTIPIQLEVADITFPRQVSLNTCVWAYPLLTGSTQKCLREAAEDLSSHYINVLVVPPQNLPFPQEVRSGTQNTQALDFGQLDLLLDTQGYARTLLLYLDMKTAGNRARFGQWMTESWKKGFSEWVLGVSRHLLNRGLTYEQFAFYPFDETIEDDFYQVAKLIKKVHPKLQIFANWFGSAEFDFRRALEVVDIWCPQEKHCRTYPAYLTAVKARNPNKVWTYNAEGPGRANHPYSHYRLLPWRGFDLGLSGAAFWVYVDFGPASPWDDTERAVGYYGVVYSSQTAPIDTRGEKLIPSRRWEAWRQGVQDYEYLTRLERASGNPPSGREETITQARHYLSSTVSRFLNDPPDIRKRNEFKRKTTEYILTIERQ